MQIYIAEGTQQTGPFDLDTITTGLRTGKYQPTQLAWYEGAPGWEPISKLPGMEAVAAPPPPPPPAAPPAYPPAPSPPSAFYSPPPPSPPASYSPPPGAYSPAPPPYSPNPSAPPSPYASAPPPPTNPYSPPPPYFVPPPSSAPYAPGGAPPYAPAGAPPKKGFWAKVGGVLLAILAVVGGVIKITRPFTRHSYSSSSSYYSTPTPIPTPTPRDDLVNYVNKRSDYPTGDRATHFIAFTLKRPKYWGTKWSNSTSDKNNFLELEHKRTINGVFDTSEQFNVGSYHTTPNSTAVSSLPLVGGLVCPQLEAGFKQGFPNLHRDAQGATTINGYSAFEYSAHASQKDKAGTEVTIYFRVLLVAPPTGPDGVLMTILSSSYEPEITSASDVGVNGDTGAILKSFRF